MDKPIFILINGLNSSNLFWKYEPIDSYGLRKLDFLDKLKKLGDIYEQLSLEVPLSNRFLLCNNK